MEHSIFLRGIIVSEGSEYVEWRPALVVQQLCVDPVKEETRG